MSNLRQAAQQALAEMRRVNSAGIFEGELDEAIRELETALAEPEQPHDLLCVCGAEWDIYSDGREELVATPDSANRSTDSAEPFCNQEPVAEIVQAFADLKAVSFGGEMPPVGTKLYAAPNLKPEQEPVGHADLGINNIYIFSALEPRVIPVGRTPLYTAPTPRKPLTEPELHAINPTWPAPGQEWGYEEVLAFARAIERAHGIGEQHE